MYTQAALKQPRRLREDLIGELLAGRYRIEHKLGEGAMGAVYRARHVKVGRLFAIKVLHAHLLDEHKLARRFEREAELAGRLHHPNVIGVVDVSETPDGRCYLVMDYVEGMNLASILTRAPMPAPRIIPLVRQLLEGLYHAHEAGLIHRDFKPENVLVEKDDHGREVPRIVDFGISILRDGGASSDGAGRLTTDGLVLGTPHYMAPEQAIDDPIDHRIDLFALGIVVYEMLCGRLPFDGTGAEVARANMLLDPPPIAQRVPHLQVDPLLEAFARRLMAKDRNHRPATAKHARELLDLIQSDRVAAATALGVPATASADAPAAARTSHVSPPPHARTSSRQEAPTIPGTPARGASLQPGSARQAISVDPLRRSAAPTSSRRHWRIAGGLGLAVAAAIAVLLVAAGDGKRATPPEAQQLAMAVPQTPAAAAPVAAAEPAAREPARAPTTPARPPEVAGGTVAPAVFDAGSGIAIQVQLAVSPIPMKPAPAAPAPAPVAPATAPAPRAAKPEPSASERAKRAALEPDLASTTMSSGASRPDAAKATAERGHGRPAPAEAPAESPAPTQGDANQRLLAEYRQLNSELTALEQVQGSATTQDLWQLYRHVGYYAAIQDDSKRQTLIANLATIRAELAKRKQR
jgi:serine/threonine protein kinase